MYAAQCLPEQEAGARPEAARRSQHSTVDPRKEVARPRLRPFRRGVAPPLDHELTGTSTDRTWHLDPGPPQLLCERLGTNLGPFLQMLGSGHTVDQALSTHGVQPDTFYAEWRKRVGLK